jgi:hypothetical protein
MLKQITTTIRFDVDRAELERFISRETTIDSLGRVLDETEFRNDGQLVRKVLFRYSSSGDVSTQVEYDSLNNLIERQDFIEGEDGELQQVITEFADGSKLIKSYDSSDLELEDRASLTNERGENMGEEILIFNEQQQAVREVAVDAEGKEMRKIEKEYDVVGRIVSENEFEDERLKEIRHFTYNLGGLLAEKLHRSPDGRVFAYETIVYDDAEHEIKREWKNLDSGVHVVEEFHYDDKHNLVLSTVIRNGKLVFRNSCVYDDDRRLISEEIVEIDWSGKVSSHEKQIHEYQDE